MPGSPQTARVAVRPGVQAAVTFTPAAGAGWAVIAVPGGTYDRHVFSCPVPGYSLAARFAAAGITVIAVDRPGTGDSSPVPGPAAGRAATAETIAAVTRWARHTCGFRGVAVLGHGLGAAAATAAAAMAGPARPQLLILAGVRHDDQPPPVLDYLEKASADPRFPDADAGWAVAADPARRHRVLHGDRALPEVLGWDRGTMVSARECADGLLWAKTPPGMGDCAQVTCPVLLLAGDGDSIIAAASAADLAAAEQPWYPRAPAVSAHLVPGGAHNPILAPAAGQSLDAIAAMIPLVPAPARR